MRGGSLTARDALFVAWQTEVRRTPPGSGVLPSQGRSAPLLAGLSVTTLVGQTSSTGAIVRVGVTNPVIAIVGGDDRAVVRKNCNGTHSPPADRLAAFFSRLERMARRRVSSSLQFIARVAAGGMLRATLFTLA